LVINLSSTTSAYLHSNCTGWTEGCKQTAHSKLSGPVASIASLLASEGSVDPFEPELKEADIFLVSLGHKNLKPEKPEIIQENK